MPFADTSPPATRLAAPDDRVRQGLRLAGTLSWVVAATLALAPPLAWLGLGDVVLGGEAHSRARLLGTAGAGLAGLLLAGSVLASLRRVSRREQALLASLVAAQERAHVTLHAIADAVVSTDAQQCITYLNPMAERLLQTSLGEVQGQALQQICPLVDEDTLEALPHPISTALTPDGPASTSAEQPGSGRASAARRLIAAPGDTGAPAHLALLRGDGSSLPIEQRTALIHDRQDQVIGAVMVFRDVTTVRRMAQRINWTSTHDALTGLVNRRELEARAAAAMLSARNSGTSQVLCCINLDQFKLVNESFGHNAGDSLLKQVAVQLQSRLREADTLARLDGDAFGVLLEGCGLEAGERIAQSLLDTLRGSHLSWEGRSFTLQASIGLAALDPQDSDRAAVFAAADAACSAAKEQGRNRVCVFRGNDAEIAQRRNDMGWAARLNAALDDGRFMLYYQAYQALGNAVAGANPPPHRHVEILLRLLDEEGHTVAPGDFMPAAERYNVMPAIDRWVIRNVFSRYADLAAQLGTPALTCAINLSGTSINAEGLLEFIQIQARSHALPPGAVCFEITETAAIHNIKQAAQFMTAVKALGFSFALDDFGVGSSSFGYLKHLPVDLLKIDGSFVRNMVQDPVDRAMVDTINRVGHIMGLKTVAEFAESEQIIEGLRRLGVDYAQGYGVHRPQPLPEPRPARPAAPRPTPAPLADLPDDLRLVSPVPVALHLA